MTKTDGLVRGTWSLMLMCFFWEPGWPFDPFVSIFLQPAKATCIHCEMSVYMVAHVENSGVTTPQPPLRWQPSQSKKQLQQASFFGWGSGEKVPQCCQSRWWFQIFVIFTPTWGDDPIWLIFFRWVETCHLTSFGLPEMRNCHSYSSSWNHLLALRPQEDVFLGETQKQSGPLTGISMVLTSLVGVLTGLPFTRPLVGVISFNLKL